MGFIISNHNCDANLIRQIGKFYTNANMLVKKISKCFVDMKGYLFKRNVLLYTVLFCGLIIMNLQ